MTFAQAGRARSLPGGHSDPFDRMLIARSLGRGWKLVSNEVLFDALGIHRL